MVLILGYELDGTVQRDLPPAGAEAGVLTAGPQRLVEILEQGYALPTPNATPLQRMLGYQQALQQALQQGDDGARRLLTGDPQQVAADIQRLQDMGVNHLMLNFPADSLDATLKGMDRFANKVKPLL